MAPVHRFYLNLGSNILPEQHLVDAVRLLRDSGKVNGVSSVWESQAVGSDGPNFLNISVCFESQVGALRLKRSVVRVIENALGRSRTSDKNAPRTIDIDILWEDDHPVNIELWMQAFVILPMAELLPQLAHPVTKRPLADEALWTAASLWIQRRPDVMIPEE